MDAKGKGAEGWGLASPVGVSIFIKTRFCPRPNQWVWVRYRPPWRKKGLSVVACAGGHSLATGRGQKLPRIISQSPQSLSLPGCVGGSCLCSHLSWAGTELAVSILSGDRDTSEPSFILIVTSSGLFLLRGQLAEMR